MAKKSNKSGAVKRLERFEESVGETIKDVFARHLKESAEVNKMWDDAERELFGGKTVREVRNEGVPVANIPGIYEAVGDAKKLREQG